MLLRRKRKSSRTMTAPVSGNSSNTAAHLSESQLDLLLTLLRRPLPVPSFCFQFALISGLGMSSLFRLRVPWSWHPLILIQRHYLFCCCLDGLARCSLHQAGFISRRSKQFSWPDARNVIKSAAGGQSRIDAKLTCRTYRMRAADRLPEPSLALLCAVPACSRLCSSSCTQSSKILETMMLQLLAQVEELPKKKHCQTCLTMLRWPDWHLPNFRRAMTLAEA